MNMGDKIHRLRNSLDFTLQELGDKVGVSASTVRKWETGMIKTIRADKIQKLATALDTSIDYLMTDPNNEINVNSVETNNGVIGQNSGEINITHKNSKEEVELLRIFNVLTVKDRCKLMNFAWSLEENSK